MSWWWWVVIGVVLAVGAAAILAVLGLSVYRKARDLFADLGTAGERLRLASEALDSPDPGAGEPAVFADPSRLRQERYLTARQSRAKPGDGSGHGTERR